MTKSVGFTGKRNDFRNETFETRCEAIPRKKMPAYSAKHPFPNKNAPILCHCEERSDVAILKPKVWHSLAKHGVPARRISNISETKMVGFITKPAIFVSLRGRRAAVAIFKPKVWHPVAKHGSGKRQNPQILISPAGTPQRAPPLYSPARNVSGSSGWWLE